MSNKGSISRMLPLRKPSTYNPRPQIIQPNRRDINAINDNTTTGRIHESEDTHRERRLATSCTTQQTDTFSRLETEGNILEDGWELRRVLDHEILDDYHGVLVRAGRRWPVSWRAVRLDDGRRFLREIQVLNDTLDGATMMQRQQSICKR